MLVGIVRSIQNVSEQMFGFLPVKDRQHSGNGRVPVPLDCYPVDENRVQLVLLDVQTDSIGTPVPGLCQKFVGGPQMTRVLDGLDLGNDGKVVNGKRFRF